MNLSEIKAPKQRFALVFVIGSIVSLGYFLIKNLIDYLSNQPKTNTDVATTSSTTITEVSTGLPFAKLGRKEVSNAGTITEGKIYVRIENIGNAVGTLTIDGETSNLNPGDTWQYPDSNRVISTKQMSAIAYNATGTTFLIETEAK